MTSHPKRGMKLLITHIMIRKFISQPQLSVDFKIYFSIRLFATVTTEQGALIIGGYDDSDDPDVATVACYNSGWSRLDDLQSIRRKHRTIINGDKVYVIGGYGQK